jgi:hypothetical protein
MAFRSQDCLRPSPFSCPACGGSTFRARGWVPAICEIELDRDADGWARLVDFGDGVDAVYDWQRWTHASCGNAGCGAEVRVQGLPLTADLDIGPDQARRLLAAVPPEVLSADEEMLKLREELRRTAALAPTHPPPR